MTKEVERLRPRATAADRLEQENRALLSELESLRKDLSARTPDLGAEDSLRNSALGNRLGSTSQDVHQSPRQPLGTLSASSQNRQINHKPSQKVLNTAANDKLADDLVQLQKKYAHLSAKHDTLLHTFEQAKGRIREMKNSRDSWKEYSEKLESKLQKLETKLGRVTTARRTATASPRPLSGAATLEPQESNVHEEIIDRDKGPLSSKPVLSSSLPPHIGASHSFSGTGHEQHADTDQHRASSSPPEPTTRAAARGTELPSDSTEGDDELPPLPISNIDVSTLVVKSEPASDGVEVLHERSVTKRKRGADHHDVVDVPTPRRIKTEEGSSDLPVTAETSHFSPQESMDLDIDEGMPTPRRSRMIQSRNLDHENYSASMDRSHAVSMPNLGGGHGPIPVDSPPAHVAPLAAVSSSATPVRRAASKTSKATESGRRSGLRLDHAVASLAEDRDTAPRPGDGRGQDHASDALATGAGRLSELLNGKSAPPHEEHVLLRPVRQVRDMGVLSSWFQDTPRRVLPFGDTDGKEKAQTPLAPTRIAGFLTPKATPASRGDDLARLRATDTGGGRPTTPKTSMRPLRQQPVTNLRRDDFKINPEFNNGENYAFTEVVRGKAERAELPGCTDPDCCGKHFRAMAQAERQAAGPSLIHRPADIKLLEDYLGDLQYKLGSMTRQEKEELWLEAKTRELANKHGKHRHRFSRRQSPPGFWNADFPTTQESQEEREEEARREKALIEERYKDAMRGGGQWLFRDE